MLFQPPQKRETSPARKRTAKKRKPSRSEKPKPEKPKKTKKVKWAKPPKYTPEDIARIERMFAMGRGEKNMWYDGTGV